MKEQIIKFERGKQKKKYKVHLKDKQTKKIRTLSFGHKDYQQFKDRTKLQLYKHLNHGERKRMRNYYSRHSGVKTRKAGILKEKKKNKGCYTPKLLSHIYLW